MLKNKVRELRCVADESQEELAAAVGVTRVTIHSIERNKTKNVKGEIMLKIASHFKIPVEEIFFTDTVN